MDPRLINNRFAQMERAIAALQQRTNNLPARFFVGGGTRSGANGFWAQITSSLQDGSNKRWVYQVQEMSLTGAGYTGWTATTSGRAGEAHNLREVGHGTSGQYSNGAHSDDFADTTLDIVAIPSGIGIIWVEIIGSSYWFSEANGLRGGCES